MTIAARIATRVKEFHRPYNVEMPEPLQRVQWTLRRKILLAIMLLCGSYYLWRVTYPSTTWLLHIISSHNEVAQIPAVSPKGALWSIMQWLQNVCLAVTVLICMWGIAGNEATGLSRPVRVHATGLGYYLRMCIPYAAVASLAYLALIWLMPSLNLASARHAETDITAPYALLEAVVGAVSTAIAEEIIATALIYWLLDRVRTYTGRTLAATGWGTLIIIATHLMYHTYYGTAVVMIIPSVYFTVICWRHTRSLLAIVAGHALWDLALVPPSLMVTKILLVVAFWMGLILDRKPKAKKTPAIV